MKNRRFVLRQLLAIVGFAVILTVVSARAQDAEPKKSSGSSAANRKSTKIDFEDQLVEGQAQKPELFYMLKQKNANFKKLIRLRDDFLPEMKKTAEDIQRKGSGN